MGKYKTEQEEFWATEFGDDYISRNKGEEILSSNINLFAKILERVRNINSVIEFGANIGLNLKAINHLLPKAKFAAVEINKKACQHLEKAIPDLEIFNTSILNYEIDKCYDLSLIKGVLIHINPDQLPVAYDKIYRSASKYICIAEYYNPTPVTIKYRGHSERLFKRDFAGEMLKKYSDLELLDYGFQYHKDPLFPLDDITWFLLARKE